MLLGFISLLLTVGEGVISRICISEKVAGKFHPCSIKRVKPPLDDHHHDDTNGRRLLAAFLDSDNQNNRRILALGARDKCAAQGKVPFVSSEAIHQLHIFIFVLAVFHVLYCILTLALGRAKMRRWKRWEVETKTAEYQFSHDPERFRFARETSFGRRHLSFWTQNTVLVWIVCFFRQFVRSVPKVDYLTLRHGFMMTHLGPQSHQKFNFRKYIKRSLEEDFKVVVEISPPIWFITVLFLLFNTHGWYSYLWLPFAPLIIVLLVGTKLQVIITKMGQRIQQRGEVVKGVPLVQPGDDLFWFNKPRLILYLINFVLFQNAFQLAFFSWAALQFMMKSCFHSQKQDVVIRISMGIFVQFLCSYVTLPLYALVTQMGSTMKPTIFNERVARALRKWHHTAKKNVKHNRGLRLQTPNHTKSNANFLRRYHSEMATYPSSPIRGSSQSQSSTSTATRPGPAGMAPRGSAAATAGMRRRRLGGGNSSASTGVGGGSSNMLRFYTDDAPGLKISPTVVLVMSLCFIGFVTALHVFGKLYRSKSGGTV
uniref:MLO-like protein n=1 Tax=Glycine max TaxID=3847 RepID=A0A0R0GXL3_SOYBN